MDTNNKKEQLTELLKQFGVGVEVLKDVQCRDGKPGTELDRIVNAMQSLAPPLSSNGSVEEAAKEYCDSIEDFSTSCRNTFRDGARWKEQQSGERISKLIEALQSVANYGTASEVCVQNIAKNALKYDEVVFQPLPPPKKKQ